MTAINVSPELEDWFNELNEYLHGSMHIEEHFADHEEYLESLDDEAYKMYVEEDEDLSDQKEEVEGAGLWPFTVDFYGHPSDENLPLFEDKTHGKVA